MLYKLQKLPGISVAICFALCSISAAPAVASEHDRLGPPQAPQKQFNHQSKTLTQKNRRSSLSQSSVYIGRFYQLDALVKQARKKVGQGSAPIEAITQQLQRVGDAQKKHYLRRFNDYLYNNKTGYKGMAHIFRAPEKLAILRLQHTLAKHPRRVSPDMASSILFGLSKTESGLRVKNSDLAALFRSCTFKNFGDKNSTELNLSLYPDGSAVKHRGGSLNITVDFRSYRINVQANDRLAQSLKVDELPDKLKGLAVGKRLTLAANDMNLQALVKGLLSPRRQKWASSVSLSNAGKGAVGLNLVENVMGSLDRPTELIVPFTNIGHKILADFHQSLPVIAMQYDVNRLMTHIKQGLKPNAATVHLPEEKLAAILVYNNLNKVQHALSTGEGIEKWLPAIALAAQGLNKASRPWMGGIWKRRPNQQNQKVSELFIEAKKQTLLPRGVVLSMRPGKVLELDNFLELDYSMNMKAFPAAPQGKENVLLVVRHNRGKYMRTLPLKELTGDLPLSKRGRDPVLLSPGTRFRVDERFEGFSPEYGAYTTVVIEPVIKPARF